jgi:two-component system sensor histidine kinase GlrK
MSLRQFFSLKYLAAFGFFAALVPLLMAAMYAAFAVEEMTGLGHQAIYQVLKQASTARLVTQRVKDVERKARLFAVLSDPSLRDPYERKSYEDVRAALGQALDDMRSLPMDPEIASLIDRLTRHEERIHQRIIGSETDSHWNASVDEDFRALHGLANQLRGAISGQIDRAADELREGSKVVQQRLLIQASVLLPVSIVLIAVMVNLFARAVRQLERSIRRLGAGDFGEPIRAMGPQDLRDLGDDLEWLRTRRLALEASEHRFILNFSQEMKTPLTSIHEGAERLADETLGGLNPQQSEFARRLTGGTRKLKALIDELVSYRQVKGPLEQPKQPVQMQALVRSVVQDYAPALEDKSVTIKELIQPMEVLGVPDRLRTLVDQLISNAVQFSPVGGEIRIMLRASGSNMELEVEDDGPGIEEAERARVFEPFFRGKAAGASEAQGPGLGLAIACECVAGHQGTIEVVEPRQDKQGARIRVQIPLLEAE